MASFGVTFDVKETGRPDTVEQAADYVRRWADVVGMKIPDDAESIHRWEAYRLRVEFRWESAWPEPSTERLAPLPLG